MVASIGDASAGRIAAKSIVEDDERKADAGLAELHSRIAGRRLGVGRVS